MIIPTTQQATQLTSFRIADIGVIVAGTGDAHRRSGTADRFPAVPDSALFATGTRESGWTLTDLPTYLLLGVSPS